jgi:hypothetical protein
VHQALLDGDRIANGGQFVTLVPREKEIAKATEAIDGDCIEAHAEASGF